MLCIYAVYICYIYILCTYTQFYYTAYKLSLFTYVLFIMKYTLSELYKFEFLETTELVMLTKVTQP